MKPILTFIPVDSPAEERKLVEVFHHTSALRWSADFFQDRLLKTMSVSEVYEEILKWFDVEGSQKNLFESVANRFHLHQTHGQRLWSSLEFIERLEWSMIPMFLGQRPWILIHANLRLDDQLLFRFHSFLKRIQSETGKNIVLFGARRSSQSLPVQSLRDLKIQVSRWHEDKVAA